MYEDKGLSPETARIVAEELDAGPVLAHVDIEPGIDPDALTSPVAGRFIGDRSLRCTLPLLAIVLPGADSNRCDVCGWPL